MLAHEIGHHSSGHLREGIWWFGLFAAPGAYLLMLVTRRRGGMGAPEAVPLALFVTVVFYLALTPVQNSDHPPDGGRGRLEGARVDPRPEGDADADAGARRVVARRPRARPAGRRILFDTTPRSPDRVAMAEAWAARNR